MKIGLFTDSLPQPFSDALDWVVEQGIEAVEIGTGNFSPARHCDLDKLLNDQNARKEFSAAIEGRGLILSALNCNGNLLDPHPERRKTSQDVYFKTVELANKLGLDTIVTMSGCPGDPDGGTYPNWVTHFWQPEFKQIITWQWDEEMAPFWEAAAKFAADRGIRVAIEMHPGQCVYNTASMLRLREIAGPSLGANFDPSHLFYQRMDPLLVIRALGEDFIFHVHAKDARIDPHETALNGVIDLRHEKDMPKRSWCYRTLGFGHGEGWWRDFVSALRAVGYDGTLSIEHEDLMMSSAEGIIKSVEFLKPIVLRTQAEGTLHWVSRHE